MKTRMFLVIALAISLLLAGTSIVIAVDLPPLTAYTENFDTLANNGTSSVVPAGWAFSEADSNANTTYTAGTGSSNTGDTYSFGASAASDRAFGGLASGSLQSTLGVSFTNQTGGTIGRLVIGYNCEQWRLGHTTLATDTLTFAYSLDATSLTDGVWTTFDALDCKSTVTSGVSTGPLDGNTNRTAVGATITGLSIANGATFWLRWTDIDIGGSDDGLAIDDFVMNEQTATAVTLNRLTGESITSVASFATVFMCAAGLVVLRKRR